MCIIMIMTMITMMIMMMMIIENDDVAELHAWRSPIAKEMW